MAEKDSSKERKTTDETKFDVSKIFSTPPEKPKVLNEILSNIVI